MLVYLLHFKPPHGAGLGFDIRRQFVNEYVGVRSAAPFIDTVVVGTVFEEQLPFVGVKVNLAETALAACYCAFAFDTRKV
ncbi:hypothetical protein [Paracoccus phage vB_PmaS-R3]|uniref:Uncharacterized protein n=1 Tax=Paracoccus phage vB_PmaS-R3 TaxID=2494563 RepID=A0A0B5A585_9CAUD|nr:hypothetical protein VC48_gp10 [Paracoccus phage vB_PmaS-R3]AJD83134.1 hypothetical protein [Paracoccus phage vB_PmaS-R3]